MKKSAINIIANQFSIYAYEKMKAKLDKDRKEKKCEYAILVSMLEADSEYYNQGIVDLKKPCSIHILL